MSNLSKLDNVGRTNLIKNRDGSWDRIFYDVYIDLDKLVKMARRAERNVKTKKIAVDGPLTVKITSRRPEPK